MKIRIGQFAVVCASILIVSSVVSGMPTSITLTTDSLGLGSSDINYAKNDNAVEADRAGLFMSTANNIGSVLTIREDGTAGVGIAGNEKLVTITARSHLDIQNNLPAGYDIYGGVITLTDDGGNLAKEGLGVRAFGLDTDVASVNYGKRYVNPDYIGVNGHGFQMEGSKEISGGSDFTDWDDFVADNPGAPSNNPPHVDEDVTFDFNNDLFSVRANSVTVLLTKIGKVKDNDPFNLAMNLTVILADESSHFWTYESLYDAPDVFSYLDGYDDVVEVNFGAGSLGFNSYDAIDSFIIGARDDPADPIGETDEHFLINGFSYDVIGTPTGSVTVPTPGSMLLGSLGVVTISWIKRKKLIA